MVCSFKRNPTVGVRLLKNTEDFSTCDKEMCTLIVCCCNNY